MIDTTKHTNAEEWTHPLFLTIQNNEVLREQFKRRLALLCSTVDQTAREHAAALKEWHDDPQGDPQGHAAANLPWDVMHKPEARAAVLLELVEYFLTEGGSTQPKVIK